MALVFNTPKSALNTTSKDIQNLSSDCPPCPEVNLTTADVEYTRNGEYTVTPEEGYDGLTQVDITVNIPMTQKTIEVASLGSKTFTPSEGGYSEVTLVTRAGLPNDIKGLKQRPFSTAAQIAELESEGVNFNDMYNEQDAVWILLGGNVSTYGSATFDSNNNCVITFDANYPNWPNHRFIVSPFDNGQWPADFRWYNIQVLKVHRRTVENGITTYNICDVSRYGFFNATANGSYVLEGNVDYSSLFVNVPSDIRNQDKLVVPTTSSQTITADSGYSGIGTVSVEAVTSSIDANIAAGNIKKNVSILGVTGSYDPQPDLETKTVTYTTNDTYTITPTAGKDGMSSVEVTVNVTSSNCPDWSSMGWSCNDVTASGITGDVAVTAALLENYDPDTSGIAYWRNRDIVYAPNIVLNQPSSTTNSGMFTGNQKLEFLPALRFESKGITLPLCGCNDLFSGCSSLKKVHLDLADYGDGSSSNGYVVGGIELFWACSSLTDVELVNTNGLTSSKGMFKGCTSLVTAPTFNTSNITDMTDMFYDCTALTTFPTYDTSNVTNMFRMFNGCISLTSVPSLNTSKVTDMTSMFGYSSGTAYALQSIGQLDCTLVEGGSLFTSNKNYSNLTTIGGFVNLGKSFKSGNNHTLDLKKATNLTKQSLMNIINNLAAPDDTSITDATLKLSTTSYALLDASEIAIATAKNWTVTTS